MGKGVQYKGMVFFFFFQNIKPMNVKMFGRPQRLFFRVVVAPSRGHELVVALTEELIHRYLTWNRLK